MDKIKINCFVIRGGVTGLASARTSSNNYDDIFLIEQNAVLAKRPLVETHKLFMQAFIIGKNLKNKISFHLLRNIGLL